jgi:hypothetical protein
MRNRLPRLYLKSLKNGKCKSFIYLLRSLALNSLFTFSFKKAYILSSLLSCKMSRASIVDKQDKAFKIIFNLLKI